MVVVVDVNGGDVGLLDVDWILVVVICSLMVEV